MAHTYHQQLYHLVWGTKERRSLIPHSSKQRLFEYLGGAFRTAGCGPLQIGGMSDHIHALVSIPPKYAVSEIIRDIKVSSTKWMISQFQECSLFSWQEGFGSFSVSASRKDVVMQYILNQEIHHRQHSFEEEFLALLNAHGVEYDKLYLWR